MYSFSGIASPLVATVADDTIVASRWACWRDGGQHDESLEAALCKMEPTALVSVGVGIGSILLAVDGTLCLAGIDDACMLSRPGNIVMVTVAYATLVPLAICLYSVWFDYSRRGQNERVHLAISRPAMPTRVRTYLYVSHFLSSWGDNMWQFAIPILFMEVFVDTLLPSATFSLVMYTACVFAIPSVGRYLDRTNRWRVMKLSILLENFMVIISSIALCLIMLTTDPDGDHRPVWTADLCGLFAVTLVCGAVGQVLNDTQTLALERDWVVVLAQDDSSALAVFNTMMRRIDLGCLIVAPMAFGIIMDYAGSDPTTRAITGAATVGIWNFVSMPLEYVMTKDVYNLCPDLAAPHKHTMDDSSDVDRSTHDSSRLAAVVRRYVLPWRNYAQHPVFLLSFAFCGLWMTILNGSALNTVYLKWRGIPDSILGASRGAGAISGLLGTMVFPFLSKRIGRIERVGVVSIWLFWLSLAPVILAFIVAGESRVSDYVMLGCTIVSRAWLWSTDLAETQIMQEWIEPSRRGAINSMQTATYQCCTIIMQLMGIVFHDPRQFHFLVWFSTMAVLASAIGFSVWDLNYGRNRSLFVRETASILNK